MNKQLIFENKLIFYRVTGTGKPVILIHGFGEDGSIWDQQVAFLKDAFTLIVPDLPGSGQSEPIGDMSMEGMAEVIKLIIDIEVPSIPPSGSLSRKGGSGGATVIGHSMGGYITLALVEKYWNHLTAFGLFHSTSFADSDEKKATRQKGIEFIQQNGAFEFLKTITPSLFSPETKEKNPGIIEKQIASQNNFSSASLVSYYTAMMNRPDRTGILHNTVIPTLFIMGKYDTATPPEDGLKQCHLPLKSYIHVLQHSGHMGMLEEPDKSNEILKEFLLQN